ncbi:MAG: RNA polymerase sigma factor [Phycisphaerales bacterium]|nr:MAG: RNA polymerase sigma factor [Phycisphaerales bacterium]
MAKKPEEQMLVERFRQGDDSAFDRIVERHAAEVAALANRLLGWPQDVDDVVQEVFLAALTGLKTFRGDCRLRSWLFTITLNKCRHHRRRLSRRRSFRIDETAASLCLDENAEMMAIDAESLARVRQTVRALPPKYREVVVLRYLQGLETAEICWLLGVTTNTLNVRLTRARKKLKDELNGLMKETT